MIVIYRKQRRLWVALRIIVIRVTLLYWLKVVDNKKNCPANHSPHNQCCSNYEKDYCGWDSRVNTFASSYYAEGSIVSDEFVFGATGFTGYFVDVLQAFYIDLIISNSTFEDLPDPALGVLGLGEKACNPTCIDPIYNSIHDSLTWADNLFTMCFGLSTGILAIGTYDRRFQQGEMLWTVQRENELGYTYDVYDMRIQNMTFVDWQVKTKIYLDSQKPIPAEIKTNDNYIRLPKSIWRQYIQSMKNRYPDLPGDSDGYEVMNRCGE